MIGAPPASLELGADTAVDPATEDLTAALCEGRQVDVVPEVTGGRVTDQSLDSLAPFGRLAFYGMAGLVEPSMVAPRALQRRSATVAGFWLMQHAWRCRTRRTRSRH